VLDSQRSAQLTQFLRELRDYSVHYPALTHTWRFGASAVWAMRRYYALLAVAPPSTSIIEEAYVEDTHRNIDALIVGDEPTRDGERGFWYNAIIMRIDALWERLFKLALPNGVECSGPSLYALIQARLNVLQEEYGDSILANARRAVNQLKHGPGGIRVQQRGGRRPSR